METKETRREKRLAEDMARVDATIQKLQAQIEQAEREQRAEEFLAKHPRRN